MAEDQLKELEGKLKERDNAIATLEGELSAAKQKVAESEERIQSLVDDLDKEKTAHKQDLDAGLSLNDELQRQLAAKVKSLKSSLPTVDIDGTVYQTKYEKVLCEDGKVRTADELIADLPLCKKMIAEKSGMFKKV